MRSMNRATLIGNVGQEPVYAVTPNGMQVARFTLATSYTTTNKGGERQEHTEWHRLVAFRKTAELVRDYVTKGSRLLVEGPLQTRPWEKDGVKRYSTELVVRDMTFMGRPDGANGNGNGAQAEAEPQPQPDPAEVPMDDIPDVPF